MSGWCKKRLQFNLHRGLSHKIPDIPAEDEENAHTRPCAGERRLPGVIKEDKDDRYGSEAIESGFIFQIIRSGNEKRQGTLVVTLLFWDLGDSRKATSKLWRFVQGGDAFRVRSNDEKQDEAA
jgi:hypothetical protein